MSEEASVTTAQSVQNKKAPASVKIITFSGKDQEWREWSKKVIAFSEMKGWKKALLEGSGDVTDEMKSNALNFLTMSLTDKAFAFVENATDPQEVWQELNDEYEPCEDTDVYDLQEQFTKCRLSSSRENPTMWFKRLEHLNDRLRKIEPKYMRSDDDIKKGIVRFYVDMYDQEGESVAIATILTMVKFRNQD